MMAIANGCGGTDNNTEDPEQLVNQDAHGRIAGTVTTPDGMPLWTQVFSGESRSFQVSR